MHDQALVIIIRYANACPRTRGNLFRWRLTEMTPLHWNVRQQHETIWGKKRKMFALSIQCGVAQPDLEILEWSALYGSNICLCPFLVDICRSSYFVMIITVLWQMPAGRQDTHTSNCIMRFSSLLAWEVVLLDYFHILYLAFFFSFIARATNYSRERRWRRTRRLVRVAVMVYFSFPFVCSRYVSTMSC